MRRRGYLSLRLEVQRFFLRRQMAARTSGRNSTKGAEHP